MPQSCPQGCCDAQNVCQTGLDDTACGGGGAPCQNCSAQAKECYQGGCKDCGRWGTTLPGPVKGLDVDSDGTIYVSGRTPSGILIASLDHCGKVLKSKATMPAIASKAMGTGLSLSGASIYLGGWMEASGDRDGLFARFSKSTFAPDWILPLATSGQDEVWDIVYNNTTSTSSVLTFWLSGTADYLANPQITAALGKSDQTVCSLASAASGNGRNLALSGSYAYLTGGKSGEGFIARYDKSCTCSTCSAPWTASFQDGSNNTEGRDLLLVNGSLYVAGFSVTGSDIQAAIFRINPTSGATVGSHTWNPTSDGDYYMSLATDGNALYVAGVKGNSAGSGGQGVIRRYSMLLSPGWIREPGDPAYMNVEVVGGTGLVMAGGDTTGIVRRCPTSGLCP
jgi:hypothetical protein